MSDIETQVKLITENLMMISQLKKEQKIHITDDRKVVIQEKGLFGISQWFSRIWYDSREDTITYLEDLYKRAFSNIKSISENVNFLIPTRLEKSIGSLENEAFVSQRSMLEKLCVNLESSIIGLESLKLTYNSTIPNFCTLITDSNSVVARTKLLIKFVDSHYERLQKLSPLGPPTDEKKL